jgi:hypothetical protein
MKSAQLILLEKYSILIGGIFMLQTYEAIYNGNQFRWINPPPKVNKEVHVVLVMDVENMVTKSKKNIHEVLQRSWGCLGSSKSLDEIDKEINEMRHKWDRIQLIKSTTN